MAGRPKKSTTEATTTVEPTVAETPIDNDMIKALLAKLEEQSKQVEELKAQVEEAKSQQTVVVQSNSLSDKFATQKIKCINLLHNPLNLSTERNGRGKVYEFPKYGDSRLIKFDDLSDIVGAYQNTARRGCFYIADKDAVEALGLTEDYEHIYDKKTMDKITRMREETDVDLFLGLDDILKESTARDIANRLLANEVVDLNYLNRIKKEANIDILSMADDLKKSKETKED